MTNELTATQGQPEGETAAIPGNEAAPELNNDELNTNANEGENTEGGEGEGQGEEAAAGTGEDGRNAEEISADAENPKKKLKFNDLPKWATKRINEETTRRRELERQLDEMRRGGASQEQAGGDGNERPAPSANSDDIVERKAAELIEQRAFKNRIDSWAEAGNRDFKDDFTDRCNLIAGLGPGPEFMAIVTDPDVVKDGHKVVAELADDPEEAQRILRLPPVKMALELARIGDRLATPRSPAPKQISKVPAPVSPVGGQPQTTAALDDPDADQSTWSADFHKMMAEKLKGRR